MVAATIAIILAVDVVLGSVPNSSVGGTGTDKVILFAVTTTTSTTSTSSTTMPLWFLGFDEDPANLTNLLWNTGTWGQHGTNGAGAAALTWVAESGGVSAHVAGDGSADYGYLGYNPNIHASDSYSLALWAWSDVAISADDHLLSVSGNSLSTDFRVFFRLNNSAQIDCNVRTTANNIHNAAVGGTMATGTWTHVAATYDGTTTRVYMDGQFVGSDNAPALTGMVFTNCSWQGCSSGETHSLGVGARWAITVPANFTDGRFDDVIQHDKAYSHTNIYSIWLNTKGTHGG